MSSTVRKIVYEAMVEAGRSDPEKWVGIVDATVERLKMRAQAGEFGESPPPKYVLEVADRDRHPTYRVLKHSATEDFSEYRCLLETKSAVVALDLMTKLTARELEL